MFSFLWNILVNIVKFIIFFFGTGIYIPVLGTLALVYFFIIRPIFVAPFLYRRFCKKNGYTPSKEAKAAWKAHENVGGGVRPSTTHDKIKAKEKEIKHYIDIIHANEIHPNSLADINIKYAQKDLLKAQTELEVLKIEALSK